MPGRLDRLLGPPKRGRCPECGGSDPGGIGFMHHAKDCSRDPYCQICGLLLLPGEKRVPGKPWHQDCADEITARLEIEHEEDRRAL